MFQMPSWEAGKLCQPICHGPSWAQSGLFLVSGPSPTNITTSFTIWQSAICGLDRVCPSTSTCGVQLSAAIRHPLPSWSIPSPHWTPYFSTLQHVPKGARDAWAGLIADQCSTIRQDPSNSHAWRKFFMLPRCILANPTRGGCTQWRITQVLVKTRIRRWLAGEFMELWNDVLAEEERHAPKNGKKKTPLETLRKSNARRARQAMGDGC